MKAILKLIFSKEHASVAVRICAENNLIIAHRKHGFALDEEMIAAKKISLNLGGYGTSFSIAFDQRTPSFYSDSGSLKDWDRFLINYEEKTNASFAGLKIFFLEKKSDAIFEKDLKWCKPLLEFKKEVKKLGGQCVESVQDANIVVALSERVDFSCDKSILLIAQDLFVNALPSKKVSQISEKHLLSEEAKKIWKLLSVRDYISIKQGLKIAETLPDKIDELVLGCDCDENGEIVKSKLFQGTKPAEAHLDYALLGLLSQAGEDSRSAEIRRSLKKLDIYVKDIPLIRGFDALEHLLIELPSNPSATLKNIATLGEFPNLKKLKISTSGWRQEVLESLDGLQAPNLEEISIASIGLKDINALKNMHKLKDVDVSGNPELKEINSLASSAKVIQNLDLSNCDKLQSIQPICGASALKKIKLDGCEKIDSLIALNESKILEEISIDGSSLSSLEGLEHVMLKNVEVRYLFKIRESTSLKNLINLTPVTDDQSFKILEISIQRD
jgi:Leucine-rich repeat (LRR) protein